MVDIMCYYISSLWHKLQRYGIRLPDTSKILPKIAKFLIIQEHDSCITVETRGETSHALP